MTAEKTKQKVKRTRALPGDMAPEARIGRMIRVDQAGEYGARRIYEGQMAVLGPGHPQHETLRHMHEQELEHLATFDRMLVERQVRPTALQPLWHVAGFALGAATAMMGPKAAMACTVAVEEVIEGALQPPGRSPGGGRGSPQGDHRDFPRRGTGAPRHRFGRGCRGDPRLSAAVGRHQSRLAARDLAVRTGVGRIIFSRNRRNR